MRAAHLSVYQLTIEAGTPFALLQRSGALRMPDDDRQADLYELTQRRLAAAGLAAYEISNHARPGEESRHNLIYWRSGAWAGIGPGAHGRLDLAGGPGRDRGLAAAQGLARAGRADGLGRAHAHRAVAG